MVVAYRLLIVVRSVGFLLFCNCCLLFVFVDCFLCRILFGGCWCLVFPFLGYCVVVVVRCLLFASCLLLVGVQFCGLMYCGVWLVGCYLLFVV